MWLGVSLHTRQGAQQAVAYPSKWEFLYLYSPLDGMLVYLRVTSSIKFAGTLLYSWVERGTVRVKCLAPKYNTMSLAKAWPWLLDLESRLLIMKLLCLNKSINVIINIIFQVIKWIEEHGETFLLKHTGVGKSLVKAEALLKRHEEFESIAQVSLHRT